MYQSSENTIIKSKYFRLNKGEPYPSSSQLRTDPSCQQECFTPVFKGGEKIQDVQPLRKTDKLQKFAKIYDQYFKNASTTPKSPNESNYKNPQNFTNYLNGADKSQSNYVFSTPQKHPQFLGMEEAESTKSSNEKISSKEYLFINTPIQSYSTPLDFDNPELLLPNNAQILRHHLEKAKKQGEKLKDENLKLRLDKVKIAAKTSKNETMKLIPLKIEHQKLKKQIEKLIQEKEMLEINKKMKDTMKQEEIKINGMEFQVIKHIPGTNYSQQEVEYQKSDSVEYSRVLTKPAQYSYIQNSPSSSNYLSSSLPSDQNLSVANKSSQNSQSPKTNQSQTYFSGNNFGIKKFTSGNDHSIRSIDTLPCQNQKPLTGANLIHAEMEKMRQKESKKSNEQTSKSTFLTFAKTSLKNGDGRPTFCKINSSEFVQSLNPSNQQNSEVNKYLFNNGSESKTVNYGANNSNSSMVRPVTSTSHSPRTQNF